MTRRQWRTEHELRVFFDPCPGLEDSEHSSSRRSDGRESTAEQIMWTLDKTRKPFRSVWSYEHQVSLMETYNRLRGIEKSVPF